MITINLSQNRYNQNNYPNFKGYRTAFSKELDIVLKKGSANKNEKISLVNRLQKILQTKTTPQNLIGEGNYGQIYKIDSKYVLKKITRKITFAHTMNNIQKSDFGELKTYYGEPVAEFYDVKILKNLSPNNNQIPAGIPKRFSQTYSEKDCQKYYETVYLPLFSSVPQKSYNAIAKDCHSLNQKHNGDLFYNFDFINPNNIVLTGKTLKIADDIAMVSTPDPNSTSDLLYVFLQRMSLTKPAMYNKKALKPRQEIFKKIVIASVKNKLALGDNTAYGKQIWKVVANELCNAKDDHLTIIDKLREFQTNIPSPQKRVKAAQNYLDKLF